MAEESSELVVILGQVWFRPNGGAEKYHQYVDAARPIAAKYLKSGINSYVPIDILRGDFDADLVFLNEYWNESSLRELSQDPAYVALKPIRDEAIARANFVRLRRT